MAFPQTLKPAQRQALRSASNYRGLTGCRADAELRVRLIRATVTAECHALRLLLDQSRLTAKSPLKPLVSVLGARYG